MNRTKIPWTDYTWNPVTGCTPVSEGCEHCYAQATAKRFKWPTGVTLHPERLDEPLRLKKPSKIFVCSMSDLFHPDVPDEFILRVFYTMQQAKHHTFQVLTKRPARMLEVVKEIQQAIHDAAVAKGLHPLMARWFTEAGMPNGHIWFGVTAENRQRWDERTAILRQVPAMVHFVSYEPALEDLGPNLDLSHIEWVIAGCESGPGRRLMIPGFARTVARQCQAVQVPFFLKSMTGENGEVEALPELDGRQWLEFPEGRLMKILWMDDEIAGIKCDCGNADLLVRSGEVEVCERCGRRWRLVQYVEEVKE